MGIGTSMGAFYDDAFHHAAAQWDQKYDDNQPSIIQQGVDNATKDGSNDMDPDIIRTPLEVIKSEDVDNNVTDPKIMMGNQMTADNPRNIFNDAGDIVDYDTSNHKPQPDYDMDAWQKATGLTSLPEGQHYPDTYKLPNHMTFSDDSVYHGVNGNEGGHWDRIEGDPNYDWKFTPGKTNLDNHTPEELKDYFNKVEPRSKLILPDGHQSSNIDPSLIHQVADKSDGDIHTIGPGPEYNKWDEALQEHGAIRIPKELDEPQKWLNQDHFKDFLKDIDREDKPDGSVILRLKKPSTPMS